MINNNSVNKNKNVTFDRSMYISFNTNTGQYLFFIDLFYHLYRSMYIYIFWTFLKLIQVNVYFFNTNTGQCIFFLILIQVNVYFFFNTNTGQYIYFLILIQVNVYFLLIFFIIDPVLVLKKYALTCINNKKINKKYTMTCIIVV